MNYYILVNGQQQGPFSVEELAVTGVSPDTMVWTEGMAEWQPAWQVAELGSIIRTPDTVPPPVAPQPAQPAVQNAGMQNAQQQYAAQPNAGQTAYDPVPQEKKKKTGLWVLLSILTLIVVAAGVFLFTNPSKEKHMEKLQTVITEALNKVDTSSMDEDTKMGMQLGMGLLSKMFDQMFEYHNYGLWSTVTEKSSGETVSTGFLTMVNVKNEDDILKGMENFQKLQGLSGDSNDTDDDDYSVDEEDNSSFDDFGSDEETDVDIEDDFNF